MKAFIQLNKDKLINIFGRLSLILSGSVSVVLLVAYLSGNFPTPRLLLSIIVATAIVFPLFFMFLGYVGWQIDHNARRKAFANVPFCNIEKIGFYTSYINDASKFSFRDEIKKGRLNGFTLLLDISKEKGTHVLEFEMPAEWKKLGKKELSLLTQKFKEHDIEFRIGSLVKRYDTRQPGIRTLSELKHDLELTTTMLLKEGFLPIAE